MKPWLGMLDLVCAAHAWGQAHDEGIAAGRAANPTLRAFISAPSAQSVVPGYNSAPPETGCFGLPHLAAPSAAMLGQCRTAGPADVRCQAITTAHDAAASPRPAIASSGPAVATATAIANDTSSILGAITGSYSACGTQRHRARGAGVAAGERARAARGGGSGTSIQKTGDTAVIAASDGRVTLSVPIRIKRRSRRKLVTLPSGDAMNEAEILGQGTHAVAAGAGSRPPLGSPFWRRARSNP